MEFAVLLEPILEQNPEASLKDLLPYTPDAGFSRRLEMCLRAQRLYRAIEAPAEYIEAVAVGAGTDGLRDDKRAQHLEAVSAYRNRYGAK